MSGESPVRAVIDPFGELLTVDTPPPADTGRWVPRRKAQLVCAIQGGLISRHEACDRYGISDAELFSWEKLLEDALDDDRDPLSAARGMSLGVVLGSIMWAVILWVLL